MDGDIAKVALMGCAKVEATCPGIVCKKYFLRGAQKGKRYGNGLKVVAYFQCPGCPGKGVAPIVHKLVREAGVNVVHIAACLVWQDYYSRCPNMDRIIKSLDKLGVRVVKGNHQECVRYFRSNNQMYEVVQFLQQAEGEV
jgi:predicted metal-binding protein